MELRPYQAELVENIKSSIRRGNKAVCAVSGCGSGKSVVAAEIARSATSKGNRVLFMVHRVELCDQIRGTFEFWGVDMSLCDIMMVQTARRRIGKMPDDYAVIIIDEAHTNYGAYRKITEKYPEAVKVGFTATPVRLNDGGLGLLFTDIVKSVSTRWLIDHGFLADYKYYSVPLVSANGLHIKAGEYDQEEVSLLMENRAVYAGTVKQYRRFANGKKTMIYCSSVKASKDTVEAFRAEGFEAVHIDGTMSKKQRADIVERYRAGKIKILSNVGITNEGFDDKDIDCVILLRPTLSLALDVQMSMRSMRPKEGKTAIIIDCVGNCYKHGLPDDDREWSLLPKKKQENTVKIRECPNCFAVYPPTLSKCPICGETATHEIRTVNRKTVEVDLVEIKRQDAIRNTKLCDAELKTWDEVLEFQKLHKYKFMFCLRYCMAHEIPFPPKYNAMARKYIK